MGDHAESIRIEYDPRVITYSDLLGVFWDGHHPVRPAWRRQYMSAIFYHDAEQKRLAEASLEEAERRAGTKLYTEISPVGEYTPAEDYHQKHALRRHQEFMDELGTRYRTDEELIASTEAARLNGYLAGHGGCDAVRKKVSKLRLSSERERQLLEIACGPEAVESCPLPR